MAFKVLVTKNMPKDGFKELDKHCDLTIYSGAVISNDELLELAPSLDGIIASGVKIKEDFIKKATNLKIISRYGVGYDSIDIQAATKAGVVVTNLPDTVTESTAELTFALMLTLSRKIIEANQIARSQKSSWDSTFILGNSLYDKKLGIVGFGRIGQAVAKRAKTFGMEIYYYDLKQIDANKLDFKATYLPLEQLLTSMDYITLHLPYLTSTHHLISIKQLASMKKTAYLINAARGGLVNQEALIQALQNKEIAGAALDVFEDEPNVPKELSQLPNLVLTPHIGTATAETRRKMSQEASNRVLAIIKGEVPPSIVNPDYQRYLKQS
ncbi:glyoxylate reductase [Orenia metallireducens]|uniref:Glyoxylate reductase n=1 Tax=Orenia metallireducens TaxID=1413210 RepID=A0A285H043_9FIRM|nr:NAD(P)-dependent oxidoreductase [Orenia metallireducens]PRX21808.1 glyoxylate reductase [Orenia metallireducens]SNY29142.1 glyoxylate reductase [Orenia metallireducens]